MNPLLKRAKSEACWNAYSKNGYAENREDNNENLIYISDCKNTTFSGRLVQIADWKQFQVGLLYGLYLETMTQTSKLMAWLNGIAIAWHQTSARLLEQWTIKFGHIGIEFTMRKNVRNPRPDNSQNLDQLKGCGIWIYTVT